MPTSNVTLEIQYDVEVFCYKHHDELLTINCSDEFRKGASLYLEPCFKCIEEAVEEYAEGNNRALEE